MRLLAGMAGAAARELRPQERTAALFSRCANPRCATGWMRLWRNRKAPGFEGRWACSAECMEEMVATAVRRELDGEAPVETIHRLPVGLLLLEQGRISEAQLREALSAQRRTAAEEGESARLGEWLMESGVLTEAALTRGLSAQWNCPVFGLEGWKPEEVAWVAPRILTEAMSALPVRVRGGKLLYLAFSSRIDHSLAYAIERMTGMRVAAGIARESELLSALARYREMRLPEAKFIEARNSWALARELTRRIEEQKPVEARLVRVHDLFWLRFWRRRAESAGVPALDDVEDLIGTVGTTRYLPRRANAKAADNERRGKSGACQEPGC